MTRGSSSLLETGHEPPSLLLAQLPAEAPASQGLTDNTGRTAAPEEAQVWGGESGDSCRVLYLRTCSPALGLGHPIANGKGLDLMMSPYIPFQIP